ncbi:MAG: hypothetical protein IPP63_08310 [Chloracidobacterium sp.]|nr:hypothetical protein [Chloracidobacterium sp.]
MDDYISGIPPVVLSGRQSTIPPQLPIDADKTIFTENEEIQFSVRLRTPYQPLWAPVNPGATTVPAPGGGGPVHFEFGPQPINFTVAGTMRLPQWEFDAANPLSYPETEVNNDSYFVPQPQINWPGPAELVPTPSVVVLQRDVSTILEASESLKLDRSLGDIEISVGPFDAKWFYSAVRIQWNIAELLEFLPGLALSERMRMYIPIAKLQGRIASLIDSDENDAGGTIKTLMTSVHLSSLLLVKYQYYQHIREALIARAQALMAIDLRVLDLRNLIIEQNGFAEEDFDLQIAQIDALNDLSLVEEEALNEVRAELIRAKEANSATSNALKIFRDNFYDQVDEIILEYQMLILEFAQYVDLADLLERSNLGDATIQDISSRIALHDIIIKDSDFNNRGMAIRQSFSLQ